MNQFPLQPHDDPDLGNTYYQHWLCAPGKISVLKEISSYPEMEAKKNQWISAYEHAPHGSPIKLSAANNG